MWRTLPPAVAAFRLAMDLCGSLDELAGWWREHQSELRKLTPEELAEVVAYKDRRKAALSRPKAA